MSAKPAPIAPLLSAFETGAVLRALVDVRRRRSCAAVYGHKNTTKKTGYGDDEPEPWEHQKALEALRKTLKEHELAGLREARFAQRQDWDPCNGYPPTDTSGYGPIQDALQRTVDDIYVRVLSPAAGAALKQVGAAFRESDKGWHGRGSSLSKNQDRAGIPFHRVGTGELTPSGEHLRGLVSHKAFDVVEKVMLTLVGDEFLDDSQTRLQVANATRGGVLSQGPHADAVVVHKYKVEKDETHEQLRWLWMGAMAVICFVVSFENGNYGIPREGPLRGIFACVTLELPASAIYALTALLAGQKTFGFTRIGGKIYKLRIYHLVFGIKEQRALTVASVLVPLGGAAAAIVAADRRIDSLEACYAPADADAALALAALSPDRFAPAVRAVVALVDLGGVPAVDADALAKAVYLPAEALMLRREDRRARSAAREALSVDFADGARALLCLTRGRPRDAAAYTLADLAGLKGEREARRLLKRKRYRDARDAETPAQREARLKPLRDARAAETPAQCEARLELRRKRSRDERDALLAKHGSACDCKTKCLKRYCECFAKGVLCGDACTCSFCENFEGSAALSEARAAEARRRWQLSSERGGCTCKKSRCLKLYCPCFKAGSKCVAACKCIDCQNGGPFRAPAPQGGVLLNAARLAALREEYASEREQAAAGATPSPPSQ